MLSMYYVQLRRSGRAFAWYCSILALVVSLTVVFGNVQLFDSRWVQVDYHVPGSQQITTLTLWADEGYNRNPRWLIPWGHRSFSTVPNSVFKPKHTITQVVPSFSNKVSASTPMGTFSGLYFNPGWSWTYYPDGTRTNSAAHPLVLTVHGPNGEQIAWRTVLGPQDVFVGSPFGGELHFIGVLPYIMFLTTMFTLLLSTGLGSDIADHLSLVRTRPTSKTRFILGLLAIDTLVVVAAVILSCIPALPLQLDDAHPLDTVLSSDLGRTCLFMCLLVSMACYAIGATIAISRRRALSLGTLTAVIVFAIGTGIPGAVWLGGLEYLRPAIDALNPVNHYLRFLGAFFSSDIRYDLWAGPVLETQTTWLRLDLPALLGTIAAGLLTAILRWRLAEV